MKERKYKEDYRLETRITDRGREKRVAIYQGDWFAPSSKEDWQQTRQLGLGGFVGFLLCYGVYMRLSTPSAWCMYVLPIAAAGLIPALYWGMGLYSLLRSPFPMTRTHREKGIGRVMRSAMGCMLLLGTASVGDLIFLCAGGQAAKELPGFALLVCCAVIGSGSFFRVKTTYNAMKTVAAPHGQCH